LPSPRWNRPLPVYAISLLIPRVRGVDGPKSGVIVTYNTTHPPH
jgi:hypothetical protein